MNLRSIRNTLIADLSVRHISVSQHSGILSVMWHVLYALYFYPGFACVFYYRVNRVLARVSKPVASVMGVWRHHVFGNDISYYAKIGPGLMITHTSGIVIGKGVTVGKNCTVYNGVTLGAKDFSKLHEKPQIGDGVIIGTGTKVLGSVRIGNGARIGALTLCIRDVPAGATAVGVPARILGEELAAKLDMSRMPLQ